jgi:hypothetical protein
VNVSLAVEEARSSASSGRTGPANPHHTQPPRFHAPTGGTGLPSSPRLRPLSVAIKRQVGYKPSSPASTDRHARPPKSCPTRRASAGAGWTLASASSGSSWTLTDKRIEELSYGTAEGSLSSPDATAQAPRARRAHDRPRPMNQRASRTLEEERRAAHHLPLLPCPAQVQRSATASP